MKILVICYEYPPVGGGGGRVAEDVARRLARRGHEVRVQTSHAPSLPVCEQRDGVQITRISCLRRRLDGCTVPEMGAYVAASVPTALRLARRWRPDVVHVHFAVPSGVAAWAVRRALGTPYLLTAHLGDVPGGVPDQTDHLFRWLKPFTAPIWRSAGAVTAVSGHVARLAFAAYGRPVETLHNGVDVGAVAPAGVRSPGPPRLMFAGRLNAQKNLAFLIQTLVRLVDMDWTLDVYGDGPERARLETLVASLGLNERIIFHGWVQNAAVDAAMRGHDALVLPSIAEGFPVVAVRALAHGMALFGARIEGLEDVLRDEVTGLAFSPVDAEEARAVLRRGLSDPDGMRKWGEAGVELARRFDLDRIVDRYEERLQEVAREAD